MKKIIFIGLIVLGLALFVWAYFVEPNILLVKNIEINTSLEKDVKIVVFSDIHIGKFKNGLSLAKLVNKVNALESDLVFMPGDFIFETEDFSRLKILSEIKAEKFAVLGNHDVGFPGKDMSGELKKTLEESDIKVIDNQIEKIVDKGITLIGLSDLYQGRADYSLLGNQQAEDFVIVLAHNPDALFSFPDKANVDLVISGHTHGGQIRIPFLYKKMIPSKYSFDRGFYKVNGLDLVITSGIGMTGLPFRFLAPPEVVSLELSKK